MRQGLAWGLFAAIAGACGVAPRDDATTFGGTGDETAPGPSTSTTGDDADAGSSSEGSTSAASSSGAASDGSTMGDGPGSDGPGSDGPGSDGPGSTSGIDPTDDTTGAIVTSGDPETTTGMASVGEDVTGFTSFGTSTADDGAETGAPDGFPNASAMCSGFFDEHFPDALGDPELIILGVYEPIDTDIAVSIDRAGPAIILVLSSYEPVHWVLDIAAGTDVQEVILNGYEVSTVEGAGAATVTDRTGIGNYLEACAYEYPDDGGCETDQLIAAAEDLTDTTLALFAGCYDASSFSVQ